MKYINKLKDPVAGNRIVEDFLARTQLEGKKPSYQLFSRNQLKNELKSILLKEQEDYCCYCMRKLEKFDSTTLEHVIPKSVSTTELKSYLSKYPGCFCNIAHIDDFTETWIRPPYPHTVAYYNLLVSCKGMLTEGSNSCSCCNNKRVREQILPLPFVANIENIITYAPTGQVYASDNDPEKTRALEVLNLNCGTIKEIRKLWYQAKKKGVDVATKNDLLKVYDGNILNMPNSLRHFHSNDYYFSLFLDYKWFYQYYYS